ncbi:unnamed protein product [Alopecurus aequalis]
MGSTQIGGDDRISKLADGVLGHILSFLPAQEAARAAALSTRWRDVFASVHTVSLEEPEEPIPSYDDSRCYSPGYGPPEDPNPPPPFTAAVTAALLARHRAAAQTLRVFRVDMGWYCGGDSSTVDSWLSYAQKQAGAQLEIDLRLRRATICTRPYSLHAGGVTPEVGGGTAVSPDPEEDIVAMTDGDADGSSANHVKEAMTDGDADGSPAEDDREAITDEEYDDVVSLAPEKVASVWPWELPPPEYTIPRGLFSCTALRSLRIGPCRLSPPAMISLPSLEELRLTLVSDDGQDVQRLISACPSLADLTLEACEKVTALSLLDTRLRRLALRCCHNLASVAVDSSELQAFEYRGSVPEESFLTMSRPSLMSCKVDICGREFSNLRHLELMGCLPQDDATIVSAMSRLLQHAPELEVLSLVFQPEPEPCRDDYEQLPGGHYGCKEGELLDVHHLHYNQYNILDAPGGMAARLTYGVREINLVHYQGGRAQRMLAKLLLCNARGLDQLYCGFVPGPLWIRNELRLEIEAWATNKPENRIFY